MSLALCSAVPADLALAQVLELSTEPPEWVELMRAGPVEARDGRKWTLEDAEAVVAASVQRAGTTDMPIDYEHQGHLTIGAAPAAGWIKELAADGEVIKARVDWTERAAGLLRSREYRYLSPAFKFDLKTRRVTFLVGAGLTNNPALDLPALATTQPDGNEAMNEDQIKALREALGLAADADVPAILAAVAVMASNSAALAQVAEKVGLAKDAAGEAVLAAAHKAPDGGDFVPRAEYDRLASQVTELRTDTATAKAESAVDAAVQAGKVSPATREWALGYAKSDPEGFAAFAAAAPAIVTPGPSGPGRPTGDPDAALTADELAVCRGLDLTEDEFKAARKEIAARQAAA